MYILLLFLQDTGDYSSSDFGLYQGQAASRPHAAPHEGREKAEKAAKSFEETQQEAENCEASARIGSVAGSLEGGHHYKVCF